MTKKGGLGRALPKPILCNNPYFLVSTDKYGLRQRRLYFKLCMAHFCWWHRLCRLLILLGVYWYNVVWKQCTALISTSNFKWWYRCLIYVIEKDIIKRQDILLTSVWPWICPGCERLMIPMYLGVRRFFPRSVKRVFGLGMSETSKMNQGRSEQEQWSGSAEYPAG